ncbi:leucine-rich repeat protein [Leuconostoc mesenteroides]
MVYSDDAVRKAGIKYLLIKMMFIMLFVSGVCCINSKIIHADAVPQPSLKIKNGVLYGFSDNSSQHTGAKVVIPNNVTSIANTAFYNQGITSVDFSLANNLRSIGDYAFAKNSLTTVQYPNLNDNNLGWYIFYDNPISSVTFANGVTHINDGAFAKNPNLTSVTFPPTITSIGDWTFAGDRLKTVDLTTIQNTNNLSVGSGAFYGNQATNVTVLPNNVLDNSGNHPVRWYGYEAFGKNTGQADAVAKQYALKHQFYGKGASGSINDPQSFTYDCNNPTVVTGVKSGVATLGKTIVIPTNVTKVSDNAFKSLGLTGVDFSKAINLKQIGNFAFYDNQISNTLTLPSSLNADISGIGWYAFASNNITNVNLPNNSLTALNDFVFASNQLTSVDLPNTLKTMGDGTFIDNQMTNIILPANIQRVGSGCFAGNLISSTRTTELTDTINSTNSEKNFSAVLYPFGITNTGQPQATSTIKNRFVEMNDGTWKYLDSNGVPVIGKQIIDGHTYYFKSDGTQVKGYSIKFKDGSVHYFDSNSGYMLN